MDDNGDFETEYDWQPGGSVTQFAYLCWKCKQRYRRAVDNHDAFDDVREGVRDSICNDCWEAATPTLWVDDPPASDGGVSEQPGPS